MTILKLKDVNIEEITETDNYFSDYVDSYTSESNDYTDFIFHLSDGREIKLYSDREGNYSSSYGLCKGSDVTVLIMKKMLLGKFDGMTFVDFISEFIVDNDPKGDTVKMDVNGKTYVVYIVTPKRSEQSKKYSIIFPQTKSGQVSFHENVEPGIYAIDYDTNEISKLEDVL